MTNRQLTLLCYNVLNGALQQGYSLGVFPRCCLVNIRASLPLVSAIVVSLSSQLGLCAQSGNGDMQHNNM